jgi:hypothetical protein
LSRLVDTTYPNNSQDRPKIRDGLLDEAITLGRMVFQPIL